MKLIKEKKKEEKGSDEEEKGGEAGGGKEAARRKGQRKQEKAKKKEIWRLKTRDNSKQSGQSTVHPQGGEERRVNASLNSVKLHPVSFWKLSMYFCAYGKPALWKIDN